MNILSEIFPIFLLAIILPFSTLSQTATIQSKSLPSPERQNKKTSKGPAPAGQFNCLPEGFQLTDIVSYRLRGKAGNEHITIEEKLGELKAHCKRGKLVDGKGKEIRFFKFSCFGNPPEDYREIAQKEAQALEKLQKQYNVVIIPCDRRIQ